MGYNLIDPSRAMEHIRQLAEEIGPRFPGSEGERRAADYIARCLADTGRPVEVQFFDLPGGGRSKNISIFVPGRTHREYVIGAHMDSQAESPGANDNASGVAVLLELARIFSEKGSPVDLRLVFFGSEELIKKDQRDHHYGSRNFVGALSAGEIAHISGMISIDMAGCGDGLKVRSTGCEPSLVCEGLISAGANIGLDPLVLPGHAASDHESFEAVGVASAWIGYFKDRENHTARDTIDRIEPDNLNNLSAVVASFIESADAGDLKNAVNNKAS